jgi:hypothetical protein
MLRLKTSLKEKGWACLAFALGAICIAAVAEAAEPRPWQIGMQPPATEVDDRLSTFHDALLIIIGPGVDPGHHRHPFLQIDVLHG